MKIAFVIPWYGKDVAGGAEAACRELVQGLKDLKPEITAEVLTTCLKEFAADWNQNIHAEGQTWEDGIAVRRFKATQEDRRFFNFLNSRFLMGNDVAPLWRRGGPVSPVWRWVEQYYIRKMIRSNTLHQYISDHRDEYDFFIFLPYMFGTTYFGSLTAPDKSIIIPCLHNERYAFMNIYREMMESARATIYLVNAEQRLANKLYNLADRAQFVLGAMVESAQQKGDGQRFRKKYGIEGPFLLYAGRKVEGKNLPLLVERFLKCRSSAPELKDTKLVIIGRGNLAYDGFKESGILDLGYISSEDKIDAMNAASIFCMPSLNESFSIVLMEGWLQGAPALVHANCEVTKEHCETSGGGMWFSDQESFNQCVTQLLNNDDRRRAMGEKGRNYVLANFSKEKVIGRLAEVLITLKNSGKISDS
jgi:glycosyltransferase involved in cell wall biosynthesis